MPVGGLVPMPPASNDDGSVIGTPVAGTTTSNAIPDRSRLLPHNRRLRHLHGISLRNLNLSPLLKGAQRDGKENDSSAAQTRSSFEGQIPSVDGSVESVQLHAEPTVPESGTKNALGERAKKIKSSSPLARPSLEQARRRRSTLNWVGKSPQVRQRRLEDVTASRLAHTWFSLHCEGLAEPVYVSEVVPRAMNPDYLFFDMASAGPLVTRLAHATVKVWARSETMPEYELLIETPLHLPSFQFVGRTLEDQDGPLPSNSLLLHLSDGVYTSPMGRTPHWSRATSPFGASRTATGSGLKPTSSYDALMQLSSLDDCIQDALLTQEKITAQINSVLGRDLHDQGEVDRTSHRKSLSPMRGQGRSLESPRTEPLASLRRYSAVAKRQLENRVDWRAQLVQSLGKRRDAIDQGRRIQRRGEDHLEEAEVKLKDCESRLQKSRQDVRGQRRRIAEDLMCIYPVEPVPPKPLLFTVRGALLPNSSEDAREEDPISAGAALGYVAHVIHLLSNYLALPLPYVVQPQLSTSSVRDDVSMMMQGQRTFPLHPKNSVPYRFDYGVFLLNKDIEFLMSRQGLRVLDLRQTLPNLKYLLYVLSSDDHGDASMLPARIAGSIKGLFKESLIARYTSPAVSRMHSHENIARARGGHGHTEGGSVDEGKANEDVKMSHAKAPSTEPSLNGSLSLAATGNEPLTFAFRAKLSRGLQRNGSLRRNELR